MNTLFKKTRNTLWAIIFLLSAFSIKSQTTPAYSNTLTPGGASSMLFKFTKQVWLNPTIILAKQNFEQSTSVKLMILPRLNGNDTTGSSKIEKAFDKLLQFLVFKDNVQGSIKYYFNPSNPTKPFTFNTSEELWCKFTPLQKDTVEQILNQNIANSTNLNNFAALPFDSIINKASRYCKKILQSKLGSCGASPDNEFTLTKINTTPAKLTFEKSPTSSFPNNGGVDKQQYPELAQNYNSVLDVADNSNYPMAWKAMAANDVVKLKLKKKQAGFDISKLVFKNANGTETYNTTLSPGFSTDSIITLGITGSQGTMKEVVAYYTPTTTPTQTFAIGAFNVQFYQPKTLNVVLVNVGGSGTSMPTIADVTTALNAVYKNVFITWNVSTASHNLPPSTNKNIHIESSGLLSNYMPDMQPIVSSFKDSPAYNGSSDNTYYLLYGCTNDGNLAGYMPRAHNTGFVFDNSSRTVAHELGHGAFNLKHIFCTEELGEGNRTLTNNIMDYSNGSAIYKHQWDAIHNPSFVGWFEGDDEEGAFARPQLTPSWKPFTFYGSNTYFNDGVINQPNGAVFGIKYDGKVYSWSPATSSYLNNGNPLDITLLPEPINNDVIVDLFWNVGTCGYNKQYTAPWAYLKTITNTGNNVFNPMSTSIDPRVKGGEIIPCSGNSISNSIANKCINLTIAELNTKRAEVEQLLNSNNIDSIVLKIKTTDVCFLYDLSYENIKIFINKLANQASNYSTDRENAIVKLLCCIREDKINLFYTEVFAVNNNDILIKLIKHTSNSKYYFFSDNHFDAFLETLAYFESKLDNESKKWSVINLLIKNKFDDVDDFEASSLETMFGALNEYSSSKDKIPDYVSSFRHLLIDECETLIDFKIIFDMGIVRLDNLDAFQNFTQSDCITLDIYGILNNATQNNCDALNWIAPQELKISNPSQSITINKVDLDQYYVWSKYLEDHPTTEAIYQSNPIQFLNLFLQQFNIYLSNRSIANADFWNTLQLNNCTDLATAINHIRLNESVEDLKKVDKAKKISVVNKLFTCPNLNSGTSSFYANTSDALTKLLVSFDDNDKDILKAFEAIGFANIYTTLNGDRFSKLAVWMGKQIIASGYSLPINNTNVLTSADDIQPSSSLLQLESNLFTFSNFTASINNKTKFTVGSKTIPYNQTVLVYVADDFTFIEQQFKKGDVLQIPMIQAFAMSSSNRAIVTEKASWLALDALSFCVGVGELKVFFTVGNYIRKGIVISDLVGTSAGALVNSLNESAITPELRYKIQMLSILASLPQLSMLSPKVRGLVTSADNSINGLVGITPGAKNNLANLITKIGSKLNATNNALQNAILTYKELLGFRPSKALNFTNFIANTGDNFFDIIVHFKDGRFVVSKEGALTIDLDISELATLINNADVNKPVRLLSCNDIEAAKELSKLTNKPIYACDGWVEIDKLGNVYSESAFKKWSNGNEISTANHTSGNASGVDGIDFIRLGKKTSSLFKTFLDDIFTLQIRAEVIANGLPAQFPNLTIDELTAIKVYTSDHVRNGNKIYQTLNTELRVGNLSDYNKGLNELLNSGLGKLTPHNGALVFRGCGQAESQIAKTWLVGDEIPFKDFKSSSISESTAINFMNSGSGDVIYQISNPKGYNICNISCLPGEAEILFKSGAKFKVTELTYLPRFEPSDPLIRVIKLTLLP